MTLDLNRTRRAFEALMDARRFDNGGGVKPLIFVLAVAAFLLLETSAQNARPAGQDPKKAAARAYLFQDPHRRIKNDKGELVNADLRPLFAWANSRKGGASPMPAWKRFEVTVKEHLKEGMLVENGSDQLTFLIKNYPRKLPAGTMLQLFVLDVGLYEHRPAGRSGATLHAFDYGIPYNPATEKKTALPKKEPSPAEGDKKVK